MAKIKGKVVHEDLEGGLWLLKGEDGKTYQLKDGDKKLYAKGQKVEVEGNVEQDLFGIGMSGPVLSVKKFKRV